MSSIDFGYFIGQFVGTLVLPLILLILGRFVPAVRRRPRVLYSLPPSIAALLALATLSIPEPSLGAFFALIVTSLYCAFQYRRGRRAGVSEITPTIVEGAAHIPALADANAVLGAVAADRHRSDNYIARHWRGGHSLAVSYWVNLVVVSTAVPLIALGLLGQFAEESPSLRLVSAGYLFVVVVSLVLWVWGITGAWRSADQHKARGGLPLWAGLAKIAVVFGMLSTFGHLSNEGPALREFFLIATGNDPMGPVTVRVLSGGRSVLIAGTMREGSADEATRILAAMPQVETLVLSSRGGRMAEAKALAGIVRARGINTYVEDLCESACTFVFLAGKNRASTRTARIGFHAPAFAGSEGSSEYARKVYQDAGLPESFIRRALGVSNKDMWYPSRDELIEAKVITRTSLGGESTLIFSGPKTKDEFDRQIQRMPLYRAIGAKYPDILDLALDRGWSERQKGSSDDQIMSAMRSALSEMYTRLLHEADDEALSDYVTLVVWQSKAVRAIGYDECEKFLDAKLNIFAVLPKEYGEREQKWLLDNLVRAAKATAPRPAKSVRAAMEELVSRIPKSYIPVISELEKYRGQPIRCDALIHLYEEATKMPPALRAAALEGMFKQ
jgi:hypothetical protein